MVLNDIRRLPAAGRRLLVLNMVNNLGSGLIMPFLVVYVHEVNGLAVTVATTALAVVSAGVLAGAPLAGWLADRHGAEVTAAAFLAVQAAGLVGYATASTPAHFLVSAAVIGVGVGGSAAWHTMLAQATPAAMHSVVFSLNFTAANASIGIGGLVGAAVASVASPGMFRALYVADAVSCAIVALVVAVGLRGTRPRKPPVGKEKDTQSYAVLLRHPAFLVVLAMSAILFCVTYAQFESGFPVYVTTSTQLDAAALGMLFAINTGCVIAAQLTLHRVLKRLRHTRLVAMAAGLWAVSWTLVATTVFAAGAAAQFVVLIAAVAVFAVAETFYAAGMPTLVNALAPDDARGRFNAAYSMSMSFGFVVGPLAAGAFLGAGGGGPFLAVVCLLCAAVAVAFAGARRWLPTTSPDPRSEVDEPALAGATNRQPEEA